MRINFNIPGVQSLIDAINSLGNKLNTVFNSAANFVNQSSNASQTNTSTNFSEQVNSRRNTQAKLGGPPKTPTPPPSGGGNGSGSSSGIFYSTFAAVRALWQNLNVSLKQLAGGTSNPGQMARAIGAGLRFMQNAAPYQLGSLISVVSHAGKLGMAIGAILAIIGGGLALVTSSVADTRNREAARTRAFANEREQATLESIAGRAGISTDSLSDLANKFGDVQTLFDIIKNGSKIKNEEERQRYISGLGLPPELEQVMRRGPKVVESVFQDFDYVRDPSIAEGNAKIQGVISNIKRGYEYIRDNFIGGIGNMLFPTSDEDVKKGAGQVLDAYQGVYPFSPIPSAGVPEFITNSIRGWISGNPKDEKELPKNKLDSTDKRLPDGSKAMVDAFNNKIDKVSKIPLGKGLPDKLETASSKLDKAAEALQGAAKDMVQAVYTDKSGVFGGIGGERAGRAYPSNFSYAYEMLRRQGLQDTLTMGAFVL